MLECAESEATTSSDVVPVIEVVIVAVVNEVVDIVDKVVSGVVVDVNVTMDTVSQFVAEPEQEHWSRSGRQFRVNWSSSHPVHCRKPLKNVMES